MLLFGFAGLAKGTMTFVLAMRARPLLFAALGLFVIAGAMAIVTKAPSATVVSRQKTAQVAVGNGGRTPL